MKCWKLMDQKKKKIVLLISIIFGVCIAISGSFIYANQRYKSKIDSIEKELETAYSRKGEIIQELTEMYIVMPDSDVGGAWEYLIPNIDKQRVLELKKEVAAFPTKIDSNINNANTENDKLDIYYFSKKERRDQIKNIQDMLWILNWAKEAIAETTDDIEMKIKKQEEVNSLFTSPAINGNIIDKNVKVWSSVSIEQFNTVLKETYAVDTNPFPTFQKAINEILKIAEKQVKGEETIY